MSKKPLAIESQEIIAEAARRNYETVRITRVRYHDNPYPFVDFRLFQRGYDEDGEEQYFPTKKGVQFREDLFQRLIGEWTLVPALLFHPLVLKKAWPHIKRESYDVAVFQAFKALEVYVRKVTALPAELVGTSLMREAFDSSKGPLTDKTLPKAEREAIAHMFAGAVGLYKNPHSHRDVDISYKESFEMLLVASHLLFFVDRLEAARKQRLKSSNMK